MGAAGVYDRRRTREFCEVRGGGFDDNPPPHRHPPQSMQLAEISTGHPKAKPDRIKTLPFLVPKGQAVDLRRSVRTRGTQATFA